MAAALIFTEKFDDRTHLYRRIWWSSLKIELIFIEDLLFKDELIDQTLLSNAVF